MTVEQPDDNLSHAEIESWFHGENIQKPEKKEEEPKPAEPSEESVRLSKLIDQLSEKVKSEKDKGGDSDG